MTTPAKTSKLQVWNIWVLKVTPIQLDWKLHKLLSAKQTNKKKNHHVTTTNLQLVHRGRYFTHTSHPKQDCLQSETVQRTQEIGSRFGNVGSATQPSLHSREKVNTKSQWAWAEACCNCRNPPAIFGPLRIYSEILAVAEQFLCTTQVKTPSNEPVTPTRVGESSAGQLNELPTQLQGKLLHQLWAQSS